MWMQIGRAANESAQIDFLSFKMRRTDSTISAQWDELLASRQP